MTDFKVGDKVRAIRNTKAPYMPYGFEQSDEGVVDEVYVAGNEGTWIGLPHIGARGGRAFFYAKDFEPVPTESRSSDFNKGDRVTCNSSTSYYATEMVGGEYTVAYATETWDGTPLVALNGGEYLVEPSTLSHVPKAKGFKVGDQVVAWATRSSCAQRISADAVFTFETPVDSEGYVGLIRNGTGAFYAVPESSVSHYTPKAVSVEKRNKPPGWTFRAAPSGFDGPRILRELEAQGAQYAVIVWGKGEDERIAVVSQGLFDRTDKLPDSTLPNAVGSSYYRVTDFGPGKQLVEDTSETVAGWHKSTRPDGTPCKLSDLKALVGRVEAWEQANAKVRVYVAYGTSGGE